MGLYAGVCEADITPPVGVWLCGYAYRSTGCTAVHDTLHARAAVLSDGRSTVAVVGTDLIGLDVETVASIRHEVEAATGIPGAAVMLNSTHTHGGPNVRRFNAMGEADPAYVDVMRRKIAGVIRQAAAEVQPVQASWATAPVQIGINRRQTGPEGGTRIGVNLAGPVDKNVRVMWLRDLRGAPIAALFSHACHGTTLGGDNLAVTGDWCGAACAHVRQATGGAVTPIFLQGCAADINPLRRGTFVEVAANGAEVGAAVLEAAPGERVSGPVSFAEVMVDLPLCPPSSREAAAANVAHWEAEAARTRESGHVGATLNAEGMLAWSRKELRYAESGAPATLPTPVQRVTAAGVNFVGIPAEVFVQYGLDIQERCGPACMALGYTNGVLGYIPTQAAHALGGYEVEGANRYYGELPFAPGAEAALRRAVYALLGIPAGDLEPYPP